MLGEGQERVEIQNKDQTPRISVGMPVYNGEPYLSDAIESILQQTMTDFELIISDNASTDKTEEICRKYEERDERIQYIRNPTNIGAAGNYNRVFRLARGAYFRWSNADDLFEPELHEKCLEVLEENPDAVLAYGKTNIIGSTGAFLSAYEDNLDLRQEKASDRFLDFFQRVGLTNVIYGLMRADAMRKTNLFGDGTIPAVDTRFMAEMALQGKFIEIPQMLFHRRMHEASSSSDRSDSEKQEHFWKPNAGGFRLPRCRLFSSYLKSTWRAPMGFLEKLRLSLHIFKWIIASSPSITLELSQYVLGRFGRLKS
jgi:glycosyltransferase involved in cell wall biosynthesis